MSLKRSRGFKQHWETEYPGLVDTDNGMICQICKIFSTGSGQSMFLSGCKT